MKAGVDRLGQLDDKFVDSLLASIPDRWELGRKTRTALADLIVRRAAYVAETILERVARACWPGKLFDKRS